MLGRAERWPARTLDRVVRHYPRTVAGDDPIAAEAPLTVDGRQAGAAEALVDKLTRYRIEVDP